MTAETNESILRRTQLFARLTEGEMRPLCARVSKRHFGRGETLFSEGDQCRGLFIVATGRIPIFKLSPSGREQVLAVEGPGSSFAGLPVFYGGVYPASASASEDAELRLRLWRFLQVAHMFSPSGRLCCSKNSDCAGKAVTAAVPRGFYLSHLFIEAIGLGCHRICPLPRSAKLGMPRLHAKPAKT